ncbi:MAG: c-type cytochrome domain-containing protein [Planctomycetaceae bacterium]
MTPTRAVAIDYATQVRPIFQRHCYRCHGPEKQESGLRLDQKDAAFAGGDSGVIIVPGEPDESVLIELVSGDDPDRVMPPTDETLTPEQIKLLKRWIAEGAEWPDTDNLLRLSAIPSKLPVN